MYYTTLNKIRKANLSHCGWANLLKTLNKTKPDDEALSLKTILESNGIDDAIWCLRTVDNIDKETRLFAVWCARQVRPLMIDERSIKALNIAEKFANGEATKNELISTGDVALTAAFAACDAMESWDASWDSWSAFWADWAAARARVAARDEQSLYFNKMFCQE